MGIFWVDVFLVGSCPGENFLGGSFPGWELSKWDLSWVGIFFGESFPGGNCSVEIIQVAIFRVGVFMLPCVEPDTDVELISNDTVAESISCDLDRALVILSFSCFPLRFNLCVMSFLNKVVSDPQSNKALDSTKVCAFDSFTGINCIKVCSAPSCVFTAASTCWGDSYVWSFSRIVVCWLV